MNVVAVVRAASPDDVGQRARMTYAVDEFARALGMELGISLPVIEGQIADAPADAYVVAYGPPVAELPLPASSIIYVNANRTSVRRNLEQYSLAAAIESNRYFEWQHRRGEERGAGVFGRKDVASAIGAELEVGPFTTDRYGLLKDLRVRDLPSLLASYLRGLESIRK